jgi:squalene-hopene/tetraprenyl-beta-curcumene cyclase
LQNRDGGVPTFCHGWGKLPFDRSAPDLTAHAMTAVDLWRELLDSRDKQRCERFISRAVNYLRQSQRADGSWVPLWFGNEAEPQHQNPVYGTAQVLAALGGLQVKCDNDTTTMVRAATEYLISARNPDGGWGGAPGIPSSIEETAVALTALARTPKSSSGVTADGLDWLLSALAQDPPPPPSPIGLYFASLWYSERLYPGVFAAAALREFRQKTGGLYRA